MWWALRRALGPAILTVGLAAHGCGVFGADEPGPDRNASEAGTETGPAPGNDAAVACVPRSVTEDVGAPDASCEGPQATLLSSSDGHCGVCGHSCMGDGCADGHCRVKEIVSLPVIANNPPALGAITTDTLYFVQNGIISSVPIAGGAAPVVVFEASKVPGMVAASLSPPFFAKGLGWTVADQMRLVSFPISGPGSPTVVIGGKSARVASDGETVYWAHDDTLQVREVGNDTPVFDDSTVNSIIAMAADRDGLFLMVGTKGAIAARARLLVRAKGGSSVREVLSNAAEVAPPVQMTLHEGYVYWADALGGVWRVSKTSTTKEPVMQLPPPRNIAKGLVVDGQNVYVVTSDSGNGGTVEAAFFVAPKCGGPARLIQSDTIWGAGLFADSSHLYWAHNAAIARMAK
jgi:hypothetical protein